MGRVVAFGVCGLVILFIVYAVVKHRLSGPRAETPAKVVQRRIADPPNFVIIVGEGIGYGDLGCYGQKQISTPHVDRLAKEGIRLSEFYTGDPTGDASCWCLLTGRDMAAAKGSGSTRFALRPQQATVAAVLLRAGYETGFVGSWNLAGDEIADSPGQHGFTKWATLPTDENEARPHPEEFVRNGQRVPVTGNADGRQGQYVTDLIVQEALSFLQQRQPGQPFFLLVVCPLPVSSDAIPSLRAYAGRDWPQSRKLYAARVTEFDRVVGVIRDEIANLRLANRTALLVTSDGSPRVEVPGDLEFFHSTGGLRGSRGTLYEGGLRVPFIARWPGQAFSAVERDDAAVCWDLLPTLAESSGAVVVPRPLDGVSMTPLLKGGIGRSRDMLYWELRQNGDLGQAVRMGDWKVIRPVGKTSREDCELYDLRKDPAEKKNVAPQHPDIVTKFLR